MNYPYVGAKGTVIFLPIHLFVGALHFINVHADCVFDVGRRVAGVGLEVLKDDSSPEGLIVKELQCCVDEVTLIRHSHKFVQVQALENKQRCR